MRPAWNWMLGGALAASLAWNWKLYQRTPESQGTGATDCASFDAGVLGLDAVQRTNLGALCERSCGESDRLERRAAELQRSLFAKLSGPRVDDAQVRALTQEIADARRRSLESCVAGILQVRTLLTPEQVSALLSQCSQGPCTQRSCASGAASCGSSE